MANPQPLERVDVRRAYLRLPLGIGAFFDTLDGRKHVRLIDLSQSGAQLILSDPEPIDRGVLSWLGFDTYAEVAWRDDEHIGLTFDRLLPLPVLVETRKRAPSVVRDLAQSWVSGDLSDD